MTITRTTHHNPQAASLQKQDVFHAIKMFLRYREEDPFLAGEWLRQAEFFQDLQLLASPDDGGFRNGSAR